MISVKVTDNQVRWAEEYVGEHNLARRGIYDGRVQDQVIGKIGERVVSDCLEIPLNDKKDEFDDGIDILVHKYAIDIKTKIRHARIMPWYGWNVPVWQFDDGRYKNNVYLFCSYNDQTKWMVVAGFISKIEMRKRSIYLPKGAYRLREDGKKFPTDEGYPLAVVEIVHAGLYAINYWEDLKNHALMGTL